MSDFLDKFRSKAAASLLRDNPSDPNINVDDKISLGVLLRVVAEADEKFLPEEEAKIEEILKAYNVVAPEWIPYVMSAVKQAADERIDLHKFTREVSNNLEYDMRVALIETLFRVACVDKDLDNNELEVIRKIAGLFHVTHKDFIDSKIKVKKEFGLEVAGG